MPKKKGRKGKLPYLIKRKKGLNKIVEAKRASDG